MWHLKYVFFLHRTHLILSHQIWEPWFSSKKKITIRSRSYQKGRIVQKAVSTCFIKHLIPDCKTSCSELPGIRGAELVRVAWLGTVCPPNLASLRGTCLYGDYRKWFGSYPTFLFKWISVKAISHRFLGNNNSS